MFEVPSSHYPITTQESLSGKSVRVNETLAMTFMILLQSESSSIFKIVSFAPSVRSYCHSFLSSINAYMYMYKILFKHFFSNLVVCLCAFHNTMCAKIALCFLKQGDRWL